MELTATDIERIPPGNLRVPRDEFVAVWTLAEELAHHDLYAVGVVKTCRWVACAMVPGLPALGGRLEPARAPVTWDTARAHEELIELEAAAADRKLARHPHGLMGKPGFLEAIVATLEWVWRGSGRVPLDIRRPAAS
ncbi:MAG: hypothetical protein ACRDQD_29880 [Nocardioidaceae bacterium]